MRKGLIVIFDGTKLRQLREERGIPLGLMAYYLNISVSALLSMERNKMRANPKQIEMICKLFHDLDKDDLKDHSN